MTLDGLDPILTSPKRLACMGAVSAADEVDFAFLADYLGLSDSDLSKHLKALADAGYLSAAKTGKGATRRTWLTITEEGRQALAAHAAELQQIIAPVLPRADAGHGAAGPARA